MPLRDQDPGRVPWEGCRPELVLSLSAVTYTGGHPLPPSRPAAAQEGQIPCPSLPLDQEGTITDKPTARDARAKCNPLLAVEMGDGLAWSQTLNSASRNVHQTEGMKQWWAGPEAGSQEMSPYREAGSRRGSKLHFPNTFSRPAL